MALCAQGISRIVVMDTKTPVDTSICPHCGGPVALYARSLGEPVAWMYTQRQDRAISFKPSTDYDDWTATPLYAHPPSLGEPVANDGLLLDAIKDQLDEFRQDEDWLTTEGIRKSDSELEILHIDTALAIAKIGMRYAHPPVAQRELSADEQDVMHAALRRSAKPVAQPMTTPLPDVAEIMGLAYAYKVAEDVTANSNMRAALEAKVTELAGNYATVRQWHKEATAQVVNLTAALAELEKNGPTDFFGTTCDGKPVKTTMREEMEGAMIAARAEARHANELKAALADLARHMSGTNSMGWADNE